MRKVYKTKRDRRRAKIRARIKGTARRPRLVVFRSNKYIYSQIIDDEKKETLVTASDRRLEIDSKALTKTERAKIVGKNLAEKAKKVDIKKVVFDRAGYKYHGRVKALAEGAREGGLIF
ncbi:TPA: 50S ribosomal protein L18 [Candidatus Bathyarchaeota archaeon]|nr:50S ribosomal protein L18 [Candidatus Bathyarchaeota archaeon]